MKIQSPWMGRVKGSAGNMTGSKVYDKNVLRAKAFEVNNPNTTAQQTERGFFAEVAEFCSQFSEAQLRTLFPLKPKSMSRRNALTKQMTAYSADTGNSKILDYESIGTIGNARAVAMQPPTVTINKTLIAIELNSGLELEAIYGDHYFVAVVFNDTKKQVLFTTKSEAFSKAELIVTRPNDWEDEDELHAIPLITNSKEDVTNKSFGTFEIMVRPA